MFVESEADENDLNAPEFFVTLAARLSLLAFSSTYVTTREIGLSNITLFALLPINLQVELIVSL